jgi:hypothetical protein
VIQLGPALRQAVQDAAKRDPRYATLLTAPPASVLVNRSPREARQCIYLGTGTGRMIEVTSYG